MDNAIQIKTNTLISELVQILSNNPAPVNSRYQDDCAWSIKYLRDSEIIGKFTQLLALLQTNEQQAINDLPYTSILANDAFMPRSFKTVGQLKKSNKRAGGYGDKTSAADVSDAAAAATAAPKIDRAKDDRRKEYQMRPLAINMYVLPNDFLTLPERMLNVLLTYSQYAHAIKLLTRTPLAVEIKYALERLYREELTIGKYSQEFHRHTFVGDDIVLWRNKPVVVNGVANICSTPYLVGLAERTYGGVAATSLANLASGEVYKPINNFVWQGDELINVRGIYSAASIKARLNVFVDGLLNGHYDSRCYISGSCIPACTVRNPLELHYYKYLTPQFERDETYVAQYWQDNRDGLQKYFKKFYDGSDLDVIVDCDDDNEFDNVVAKMFDHIHKQLATKYSKAPTLENMRILRETSYLSYRLSIVGSWMPCMFQFFRPGYNTPLGTVARFHLPIVRAYWHCDQLTMMPSFISAAMTGICVDLRYVTLNANKNKHVIIAKYWLRGFFSLVDIADVPIVEKAIRKLYDVRAVPDEVAAAPIVPDADANPKIDVAYDDEEDSTTPTPPPVPKKVNKKVKPAKRRGMPINNVSSAVAVVAINNTVSSVGTVVGESKIDQYVSTAAVWPINSPIWTGECNRQYVNEYSSVSFAIDKNSFNRTIVLNEFTWTS